MAARTDLDLDLEERGRLLDEWVETRREIAVWEARASELLVQRIAVREADVTEHACHREAIHRSMIAEYAAIPRLPHAHPPLRHRPHQQPDGTITWTSPLGRTYTDPPPRRVMFV